MIVPCINVVCTCGGADKPGYGDSDPGSISDAESARIEALVEKKFQEILRLTQLAGRWSLSL